MLPHKQSTTPTYNSLSRSRHTRTNTGSSDALVGQPSRRQESSDLHSASAPNTVNLLGRSLIPPQSSFARAIVMGNESSSSNAPAPQMSGLSVLLNQQLQQQQQYAADSQSTKDRLQAERNNAALGTCEADSASGPPPEKMRLFSPLGSSAPGHISTHTNNNTRNHVRSGSRSTLGVPNCLMTRQRSVGAVALKGGTPTDRVRRCLSSKELGTLAPPSGSPYAYMLYEKERLENSMRQRLLTMRETLPPSDKVGTDSEAELETSSKTSATAAPRVVGANQLRNHRRAQHNQAVVEDLVSVVSDLFIAESKLLKPLQYGVPQQSEHCREQISRCIHQFVSCLPMRYALGADTPSEVLLHMRLMTAARADRTKAVVHIHNMQNEDNWTRTAVSASKNHHRELRLVTICCNDANGLLEYITKLLATGGSRVLDADVMLSTDGVVLDRFVVEMTGRLRLDKFADLIEFFIRGRSESNDGSPSLGSKSSSSGAPESMNSPAGEHGGPLYFRTLELSESLTPKDIEEEMESAVPLSAVLASSGDLLQHAPSFPKLRKLQSMPHVSGGKLPVIELGIRKEAGPSLVRKQSLDGVSITCSPDSINSEPRRQSMDKRQLVNRPRKAILDAPDQSPGRLPSQTTEPLDYMTITGKDSQAGIPLIPFEELMLIEALGAGRVSTIYRAAWRRANEAVQMVALKVAMINIAGDTAHVDELRREADIAARLYHPNIVDLVGVAADQECFCLAYDFCEGGSVLGLLSDSRRYYEYLPIALDIANGMAYLHSRNVIHRDLKPSNVLLTRDHRAKIADFGMSVANFGQELTAETGTYRYMAPEVIRHEPYSTNCDVYSFGIVLWQLITREIPFATMTPIQAAYAVAEGRRPAIPPSTPRRLQEIIIACWDQDQAKRPSFTYITMALADYAKMAFSPANVGALTLQIANEMLASVEGNSTVNVDFSTPVAGHTSYMDAYMSSADDSQHSNVGLEIDG